MQLFLLLSHVSMVTAVTGCHSDRDKDDRPRENCTAAGFSDVPTTLEPTTQVLLFPHNMFSSLSWSSYQVFTEIYEIDLTDNKVPELSRGSGLVLTSLRVLRLGSNRLTVLPDHSFTSCPGLSELYLNNNAIGSLSDHTFSSLGTLEILDISSNRIKVLPPLMLHPLSSIETLSIEDNKILVMPDDWFSKKEEVPYLFLSHNPWACSCSLGYLHRYLGDYSYNVYVRDGPLITLDDESVVCDSPPGLTGKPVVTLEESDFCPNSDAGIPAADSDSLTPTYSTFLSTTTPLSSTSRAARTSGATTAAATAAISTASPTTATVSMTTTTIKTPLLTTTATTTQGATTVTTEVTQSPTARQATMKTDGPARPDLVSEVVTSSWYHTFTSALDWSHDPGLEVTSDRSWLGVNGGTDQVNMTAVGSIMSTVAPPTPPTNTTSHLPVNFEPMGIMPRTAQEVGVFCCWLAAGCVLLCLASGACMCLLGAWLVWWYWWVYRPLLVRLGKSSNRQEARWEAGITAGGVNAMYRSVLFVSRETGEKERQTDGEREDLLISLQPAGIGGMKNRKEGEESRGGVYRNTLYRVYRRQEEMEGWREEMEETRVSTEEGGMQRRGGASRRSYRLILREQRGEGEQGGLDWEVGGWEVSLGQQGEEPRSSWGEWLSYFLPSMPWGVAPPPEIHPRE